MFSFNMYLLNKRQFSLVSRVRQSLKNLQFFEAIYRYPATTPFGSFIKQQSHFCSSLFIHVGDSEKMFLKRLDEVLRKCGFQL